jgi:hypothetical protein
MADMPLQPSLSSDPTDGTESPLKRLRGDQPIPRVSQVQRMQLPRHGIWHRATPICALAHTLCTIHSQHWTGNIRWPVRASRDLLGPVVPSSSSNHSHDLGRRRLTSIVTSAHHCVSIFHLPVFFSLSPSLPMGLSPTEPSLRPAMASRPFSTARSTPAPQRPHHLSSPTRQSGLLRPETMLPPHRGPCTPHLPT